MHVGMLCAGSLAETTSRNVSFGFFLTIPVVSDRFLIEKVPQGVLPVYTTAYQHWPRVSVRRIYQPYAIRIHDFHTNRHHHFWIVSST